MTFLSQLDWRHAAKSFDPDQAVTDLDLEKILHSIKMSPSSFGLQSYHVQIITDQDLKDEIQKISWDQLQVGTCSHLLVFSARTDVKDRIDAYIDIASEGNEEKAKELQGYREMMEGMLLAFSPQELKQWATKQVYIALGFAMAACAELGVDSCPMEGCDFNALDTLLKVSPNLSTCVMLPLGYAENHWRKKVRFSDEDLFTGVGGE